MSYFEKIMIIVFLSVGMASGYLAYHEKIIRKLFLTSDRKEVIIGHIESSRETVFRKPFDGFTWFEVEKKDSLFEDDTIFTAKETEALLELEDGTKLMPSENTLISLNYKFNKLNLNLIAGKLNLELTENKVVRLNSKNSEYEISSHEKSTKVSLEQDQKGLFILKAEKGPFEIKKGLHVKLVTENSGVINLANQSNNKEVVLSSNLKSEDAAGIDKVEPRNSTFDSMPDLKVESIIENEVESQSKNNLNTLKPNELLSTPEPIPSSNPNTNLTSPSTPTPTPVRSSIPEITPSPSPLLHQRGNLNIQSSPIPHESTLPHKLPPKIKESPSPLPMSSQMPKVNPGAESQKNSKTNLKEVAKPIQKNLINSPSTQTPKEIPPINKVLPSSIKKDSNAEVEGLHPKSVIPSPTVIPQKTEALSEPEIIQPEDNLEIVTSGESEQTVVILIDSSDSKTKVSYRVQVSNSKNFSSLSVNKTFTSSEILLKVDSTKGVIYWRIRSEVEKNNSPWTEARKIKFN